MIAVVALAGAEAGAERNAGDAAGGAWAVNVAEFVDIHDMTDDERREYFDLPSSCRPALSARHIRGGKVDVVVQCAKDAT